MKKRYLILALSSCLLLSGCNFKFSIGETQAVKSETAAEDKRSEKATKEEESKEVEATEGVSKAVGKDEENPEDLKTPTKLEETVTAEETEESVNETKGVSADDSRFFTLEEESGVLVQVGKSQELPNGVVFTIDSTDMLSYTVTVRNTSDTPSTFHISEIACNNFCLQEVDAYIESVRGNSEAKTNLDLGQTEWYAVAGNTPPGFILARLESFPVDVSAMSDTNTWDGYLLVQIAEDLDSVKAIEFSSDWVEAYNKDGHQVLMRIGDSMKGSGKALHAIYKNQTEYWDFASLTLYADGEWEDGVTVSAYPDMIGLVEFDYPDVVDNLSKLSVTIEVDDDKTENIPLY